MIDIITYIADLNAFRAEAEDAAQNGVLGFNFDESGNVNYNICKIPVYYNTDGIRSICLVRLLTQDEIDVFGSLTTCERIGICENKSYIFDEGGKAIYDSVYDQSPINTSGGTYTPPEMIGVFV